MDECVVVVGRSALNGPYESTALLAFVSSGPTPIPTPNRNIIIIMIFLTVYQKEIKNNNN